jgi:isochorismate synthase
VSWLLESVACDGVDPLAFYAASRASERFFWSRDARTIAATGAAFAIEHGGTGRFAGAARDLDALLSTLDVASEFARPLLVGGFAFDDEPASDATWSGFRALRFVLPARALMQADGAQWLVGVTACPQPTHARNARAALREQLLRERDRLVRDARPATSGAAERAYRVQTVCSHERYRALVAAARGEVRRGALEKVVVARSVRLASREPIDVVALLASLRRSYPSCATFAVTRGDRSFVGASPERLVQLRERRVEATALAGSAPRGRTPDEDERLGALLRESKKDQEEHGAVVRAIRDALAPLCASLEVPESPRLLRVEGIQHLETPIAGTLRGAANLLDLAARLHPTPAVGGAPRAAALAWLSEHEALARGWYGGGVGFLDAAGGGELCAALRCGVVCGTDARLYAGAGIVAASDPEAELVETRLKLRALLVPLLEL